MELAALTQTISERLRYRDLSEFVGRRIKINAVSSVASDIQHHFEGLLPIPCELVNSYDPTVSIRKLGILTLDFVVSSIVLTNNYETGTELLKKLGYIDNPEARDAYRMWAAIFNNSKAVRRDPMGLGDLLEDINRGQTYFKIELTAEERPDKPNKPKGNRRYFNMSLPDDYFPHFFKVKRACFTNSELVWLHTYGIGVSIL